MAGQVDDLLKCGDALFGKKMTVDSLNQEIAENFYPERADFTVTQYSGRDFATNLTTSIPVIARRDLGNIFSGMLRPSDKPWFYTRVQDMETVDLEGQMWLEWATGLQYNAMYDRVTNFVRAAKEGDHDFAAFGGAVISVELNRRKNALLYRTWHPRDVAYCENMENQVGEIHRKWRIAMRNLASLFGEDNLAQALKNKSAEEKYKEIQCRHVVVDAEQYQSGDIKKKYNTPYISYYIDVEHKHIMQEVGQWNLGYVVPRWQRYGSSQYPVSPAVVAALGDARLIQSMMLTLLEAGEKAVNPPMVAVGEAIRGDVSVHAGGMTFVDSDYDERLGEVLRPLTQDVGSIPMGVEMLRDIQMQIQKAFFLDKIGLPPMSDRTTAFEISQRVSEYVRNALPLFEPMETEYNGALCEITFDILLRNGAFGGPQDIPRSLQGREMKFVFESPLAEAREHLKSQKFLESKAAVIEAAQLDPQALAMFNTKVALRDVLTSGVAPAKWLRSDEDMAQMLQQQQQEQMAQQMVAQMDQAGVAAQNIGEGAKAIQEGFG